MLTGAGLLFIIDNDAHRTRVSLAQPSMVFFREFNIDAHPVGTFTDGMISKREQLSEVIADK